MNNRIIKEIIKILIFLIILIFYNLILLSGIDYNNFKILTIFIWMIYVYLYIDKKKSKIFSINNQLIFSTSIFIFLVLLFSKEQSIFMEYTGNYKSWDNIILGINIIFIGTWMFSLGSCGLLIKNFEKKEKDIDEKKKIKILIIIYTILFIILNFDEIRYLNLSYFERNILLTQKNKMILFLQKGVNLQIALLLVNGYFNNINKKIVVILLLFIIIFNIKLGDRTSILSIILAFLYYFVRELDEKKMKLFFISTLILAIVGYMGFVTLESSRNKKDLKDYGWHYNTYDTLLLAIHYYDNHELEKNSFIQIVTNFFPRKLQKNKPLLLGKRLELISLNKPYLEYEKVGSLALVYQGEYYLNFGMFGFLFIFLSGVILKKFENKYYLQRRKLLEDMIYSILIGFLFIFFRGDLVSQITKIIINISLFLVIYFTTTIVINTLKIEGK